MRYIRKFRSLAMVACASVLLTACTAAEWNSINRKFYPNVGDSRLIDAKQRAIFSAIRTETGADGKQGPTSIAICAEPSPDALQATATALAGEGSSEAAKIALQLALSNVETASNIGLRTQTIQLLRDAYYRLCESYLSDGIDSIAYDVMQRRFQNQITALLAIEQLTGAVKPGQVALNTTAAADAGANATRLQQQLEKAQGEEAALKAEAGKAQAAVDELKKKEAALSASTGERAKQIETLTAQRDAATDDAVKASVTAQITPLAETQSKELKELESAKALREAQEGNRDTAKTALESKSKLVTSLDASFQKAALQTITSNATATGVTGEGTGSNPDLGEAVVNTVRAITLNAINQDYEAQVCFEALRYRNHASERKNKEDKEASVVKSLDSYRTVRAETGREIFRSYCAGIFEAEQSVRHAYSEAITGRTETITSIVNKVGTGAGSIPPREAAALILAVDQAAPLDPTTSYIAREINFGTPVQERAKTGQATMTPKTTQPQPQSEATGIDPNSFIDLPVYEYKSLDPGGLQ